MTLPATLSFLLVAAMSMFAMAAAPDVFGAETIHGTLDISCVTCHGDTDDVPFIGSPFDHSDTAFPLNGQHKTVHCIECHDDLVFQGTSRTCNACHDDIHNGELGSDCVRCHTTDTFTLVSDITGFHDTTRFPLRGAHRTISCDECHTDTIDGVWRGLSTDCVSCHLNDYSMTDNPDHQMAGIPFDCAMCHNEQPGFRMVYNHAQSGFDLTGAHVILSCTDCHEGSFFSAIPTDCVACHNADYNRTTEPDHTAAGYSHVCEDCHTTTAWIPATIGLLHESYPLTGAHSSVDCASCHTDGEYFGTPHECISCHSDDYTETSFPDHVALQFSQVCEDCHTTIAWAPATFNHATTAFPLTGAHVSIECVACHTNAYGVHPPTDCYACHADDYAEASDHVSQGYPVECSDCHSAAAWEPSIFDHDEFPVFSGNHSRRWQTCADCHPSAVNFQEFTCFTCHSPNTHDRTYTSMECYQCHPDGRE